MIPEKKTTLITIKNERQILFKVSNKKEIEITRQMYSLSQNIGSISEHEHHSKLKRRILPQIHVFEQKSTNKSANHADTSRRKEHQTKPIQAQNDSLAGSRSVIRFQNWRCQHNRNSVVQNRFSEHQHVQYWIHIKGMKNSDGRDGINSRDERTKRETLNKTKPVSDFCQTQKINPSADDESGNCSAENGKD